MSKMIITCPKCGKKLNLAPHLLGKMVKCSCGIKLQTKKPTPPATQKPRAASNGLSAGIPTQRTNVASKKSTNPSPAQPRRAVNSALKESSKLGLSTSFLIRTSITLVAVVAVACVGFWLFQKSTSYLADANQGSIVGDFDMTSRDYKRVDGSTPPTVKVKRDTPETSLQKPTSSEDFAFYTLFVLGFIVVCIFIVGLVYSQAKAAENGTYKPIKMTVGLDVDGDGENDLYIHSR